MMQFRKKLFLIAAMALGVMAADARAEYSDVRRWMGCTGDYDVMRGSPTNMIFKQSTYDAIIANRKVGCDPALEPRPRAGRRDVGSVVVTNVCGWNGVCKVPGKKRVNTDGSEGPPGAPPPPKPCGGADCPPPGGGDDDGPGGDGGGDVGGDPPGGGGGGGVDDKECDGSDFTCKGFGTDAKKQGACKPNGECGVNISPPWCPAKPKECDTDGFNTDDPQSPDYRVGGYSQDYVADYLVSIGFMKKDYSPGAWYRQLKETLPKNWNSLDFVSKRLVQPPKDIVPGYTVAVLWTCRYFRGHAAIVNLYDEANQCVYLRSTNWLTEACQEFNKCNCYRAPNNYALNSQCIPISKILFFWDPVPDITYASWKNGGMTAEEAMKALAIPLQQTMLNNNYKWCKEGQYSYCNTLCKMGYETFCDKP